MKAPFLLLLAVLVQDNAVRTPAEVARAYVDANFQRRDLEACRELLADDALFLDRTAEAFGGPLAEGLRGREAILELQASWGLTGSGFEHDFQFDCGSFAVYAGSAWFRYSNGQKIEDVPFATVLKIDAGAVAGRSDYGDYRKMVNAQPVEPDLEDVARAYLDAYTGRRFEELTQLAAEEIRFQDPTGVLVGGGQEFLGRAKVRENFERAFQSSLSFELEPTESFFFHRTALFAGTCRFAFPGKSLGLPVEKAEFEMPLLVVLEVRDGKVVDHRDYADYDLYLEQARTYRNASGGR